MKKRKLLAIFLIALLFPLTIVNAASLSVSSNHSSVNPGDTVKITVKAKGLTGQFSVTSSNSSVLSGGKGSIWFENNSQTISFTAKKVGTAKITVKALNVSTSDTGKKWTGSKTITINVVKPREKSTNNNLKSLSIDGLKLSPSFNSSTTSYTVEANANTTKVNIKASVSESHAKVSGTGSHNVSEGDNKFNIVVTAENGSKKTYTITVKVIDPNPIEVTINDEKYTVVKRESSLPTLEDFHGTTVKIEEQSIPALFNETTDFTLVGLKNSEGKVNVYIYDQEKNTYQEYTDIKLTESKIFPLDIDKTFKKDYEKATITINGTEVEALKYNNQRIYIIHAQDLKTGENNYYLYDEDNNTIIRFIEEKEEVDSSLTDKIKKYEKLIVILSIESAIIIFVLICILIRKIRKNKRKRLLIQQKIEEERIRQEEERKKQEEEKLKPSTKTTKTSRKKEVLKNEAKKKKKETI